MEYLSFTEQAEAYLDWLYQEEKSESTRIQYGREIQKFQYFVEKEGGELNRELVLRYRQILEQGYQPSSVNTKLAALNGFFRYIKRADLCLKFMKIQRRAFASTDQELTREEYRRLVRAAEEKKNERLSLLIQTICSTGIRVSELKYITVQAIYKGEAYICLKGKNRVCLIPQKLCRRLKKYVRRSGITSGPVFQTNSGRPLDRSNIWKMMKALCKDAGIKEQKVFPHNLRHLFARTFYAVDKDIAHLADILGHSNINTTRIYILTTGREHRRQMDALGLVV
jgi:site-specific recombinase XerD